MTPLMVMNKRAQQGSYSDQSRMFSAVLELLKMRTYTGTVSPTRGVATDV